MQAVHNEIVNGHQVTYLRHGDKFSWATKTRGGGRFRFDSISEAQCDAEQILQMPFKHVGGGKWKWNEGKDNGPVQEHVQRNIFAVCDIMSLP